MTDPYESFARHRDDAALLAGSDPLADNLRTRLIKIEQQGHRAGWDSHLAKPMLFSISTYPGTTSVQHHWHDYLDTVLHTFHERTGDGSGALIRMAEIFEGLTHPHPDDGFADARAVFNEIRKDANRARSWRFHGFGIRYEAWKVGATPDDRDELIHAARNKRLNEHPQRRETRFVYFTGRDGLTWIVNRERGYQPAVYLQRPEARSGHFGAIPHALSRITNVLADNPVPITPIRDLQ